MTRKSADAREFEMRALGSAMLDEAAVGVDVPARIILAPWGRVESQKGVFFVDEESGALVVQAFEQHGTDLPIDFEHQTLGGEFASPDGRAPAAGWIKSLAVEPGMGIVGEIEWTPQGRESLATRAYRYLSPVALIRKSDRKLVEIHSAALTNKPAIVAMEPIVNREDSTENSRENEEFVLCSLRAELELGNDASLGEVLSAAHQRIRRMDDEARRHRAGEMILNAMRAGKLAPCQRAWAETLIARDESLFAEWLRTAPIVVRLGHTAPPAIDDREQSRRSAASRARAEYRTHRTLSALTTEDAYVADALRSS